MGPGLCVLTAHRQVEGLLTGDIVADLYPSANVLGIDLSPIQTVWVPPNLKFMVDDAEAEWLHPANSFDLIHTRHTIQAFRNWPNIFERAFTYVLRKFIDLRP
jgi:Methyltransferase domain